MQTKKIKRCNFWVEAFKQKEKSVQTVKASNQYKRTNTCLLFIKYLKKRNKNKLEQYKIRRETYNKNKLIWNKLMF